MPSLDLDARQLGALNEVLADAFKVSEFDRMLLFHLNKEREEITLADDEVQRVFMVVEAAERQGWTAELVASALSANPGNAALRSFSADLGIGASPSWATAARASALPRNPALPLGASPPAAPVESSGGSPSRECVRM